MATYTLRPASIASINVPAPDFTTTAATYSTTAQLLSVLSDNNDSTYAWVTDTGNGGSVADFTFQLSTPTIPSDEFIVRCATDMRWLQNNTGSGNRVNGETLAPGDTWSGYDGPHIDVPNSTTVPLGTSTLVTRSVTWSRSVASSLQYRWYGGRTEQDSGYAKIVDLSTRVLTIKNATATPANTTMGSGNYGYIPVSIAATIDWEASASESTKLRTVTVELRVESGGSSAYGGTLITSTTYDTVFTSTSTFTPSIPLPGSLANGTYKVYARATRYREGQTFSQAQGYSEQIGAWASASLTVNVPAPDAVLTFPSSPTNGQVYSNWTYNSSKSVWEVTPTPVTSMVFTGTIMQYALPIAPPGWLLCNGQSTSGYTALAAIVGGTVPDLRGRVIVGQNSGTFSTLLATGGEEQHLLTAAESGLVDHNHGGGTGSMDRNNTHTHDATHWHALGGTNRTFASKAAGNYLYGAQTTTSTDSGTASQGADVDHGHSIPSSGADALVAHNNLQPYIVLNYIIKT